MDMHGYMTVDTWYQTDIGNTSKYRVPSHMYILV